MTRQRDPTCVRVTIKDIYEKQGAHSKELEAIREHVEALRGEVGMTKWLAQSALGLASAFGGWFVVHLFK